MNEIVPGELWKKPDDFRMAIKPRWLSEYWNYYSNPTLQSLERSTINGRMPQLSVLHGPPGTGKTLCVYNQACLLSCERIGKKRMTPCGKCNACSVILHGYESWHRRSLFEIDATHRDRNGGSTVMEYIKSAFEQCSFYRAGSDVRGGKCIVFIDEAHRMSPQQRASLLKLSEQSPRAHLILATTVPSELTVSGDTATTNPLLSRAALYEFLVPTEQECVDGIVKTASMVGMHVSDEAAGWIVRKHACIPRDILGELYRLSNHGPHIGTKEVLAEYGEEAWLQWHGNHGAEHIESDDDFEMVG